MSNETRQMNDNDYADLKAMTDRLCKLMGWEPSTVEIVRQTCRVQAATLSLENGNQIADRLEELEKQLCQYKLQLYQYKLEEITREYLA